MESNGLKNAKDYAEAARLYGECRQAEKNALTALLGIGEIIVRLISDMRKDKQSKDTTMKQFWEFFSLMTKEAGREVPQTTATLAKRFWENKDVIEKARKEDPDLGVRDARDIMPSERKGKGKGKGKGATKKGAKKGDPKALKAEIKALKEEQESREADIKQEAWKEVLQESKDARRAQEEADALKRELEASKRELEDLKGGKEIEALASLPEDVAAFFERHDPQAPEPDLSPEQEEALTMELAALTEMIFSKFKRGVERHEVGKGDTITINGKKVKVDAPILITPSKPKKVKEAKLTSEE